ncbi:ABC transporter ATP-binding protein [Halalkalibacter okhensis]|uniref:Nickel ABC transporter ATP-binding protein n=1 Tax=Halalkalibacter okhensis TaxID=333138 RepID=A0A0B0IBD5_9BACI|nr:dipeptide/oligopeptide/nickel ABC transporter ATP-binding protein [Halalkalibacter okhensis]KHF38615.1 nickel ABC transporter ATP-binding protein [Halalkalibacter okhensis]
MSLLELKDISKSYQSKSFIWEKSKKIDVLKNVSLTLDQATCTSLIGKSGSGKSTLSRIIMGLENADKGQVLFKGEMINQLKKKELKKLRGHFQMVFQDPFNALSPKMTIAKSIAEPLMNYKMSSSSELSEKVEELLEAVGLQPSDATKYPHQFSGGQLQRVNIARAIALKPELIVLDEVVSSLDIFAQVQVLDLLLDLKEQFRLSYLFISHDLDAAKYVSDKFVVMDQGKIIDELCELDQMEELIHPVSKGLLSLV